MSLSIYGIDESDLYKIRSLNNKDKLRDMVETIIKYNEWDEDPTLDLSVLDAEEDIPGNLMEAMSLVEEGGRDWLNVFDVYSKDLPVGSSEEANKKLDSRYKTARTNWIKGLYKRFIQLVLKHKSGLAFDSYIQRRIQRDNKVYDVDGAFHWNPENVKLTHTKECIFPCEMPYAPGDVVTVIGRELDTVDDKGKKVKVAVKPSSVTITGAVYNEDGSVSAYTTQDGNELSPFEIMDGPCMGENWSRFDEYKTEMNDLLSKLPLETKVAFAETLESAFIIKMHNRDRLYMDSCDRKKFVAIYESLLTDLSLEDKQAALEKEGFLELLREINSNVKLKDGDFVDILRSGWE